MSVPLLEPILWSCGVKARSPWCAGPPSLRLKHASLGSTSESKVCDWWRPAVVVYLPCMQLLCIKHQDVAIKGLNTSLFKASQGQSLLCLNNESINRGYGLPPCRWISLDFMLCRPVLTLENAASVEGRSADKEDLNST